MSTDNKGNNQASILFGLFYDIFKHSGFSMSPDQLNKLRERVEILTKSFIEMFKKEANAQASTILKAKVEVILDLEKRVSKLEKELKKIEDRLSSWN